MQFLLTQHLSGLATHGGANGFGHVGRVSSGLSGSFSGAGMKMSSSGPARPGTLLQLVNLPYQQPRRKTPTRVRMKQPRPDDDAARLLDVYFGPRAVCGDAG